ncbi:MAG: DNA methyltransferase [Flavobacteriales bacterium]
MPTTPATLQAFLTKWQLSGAAERANAQLFLAELCELLEVEGPQPKTGDEAANAYVFEKTIPSVTDSSNFIDLYKRGIFVLETKQGADAVATEYDPVTGEELVSLQGQQRHRARKTGHGIRGSKGWDTAMLKAHAQAQRYARALPTEEIAEGRPPFVIVVDVGHSIALYTDWSRMGGEYLPFPDPASYRIPLKDLLRPEVRELLRTVWTDPLALDPGRRSAKVTRAIADRLAKLARSLEGKHPPEHVANFLMRCLFTMFSEDVDLLPHGSFTQLLGELKEDPSNFPEMMENLWGTMNTGGLSPILRRKLPRFNGGLFAHADAIALNADQIQLLIEAATANWRDVEPAIFGTLLERALDPRERHKLGAHYTPRAYVERLVNPTVIEPLREQWKSVQVAALQLAEEGKDKKAIEQVEGFLHQLATVKVLDPACGSGNFLYVTLELLKRLEGEVLNTLHELGATSKLELEGVMVTPANFHGIELNPRAAAIAEQVLWIGFLQWHLRTHGNLHNLPEPIIKDLHNIQCRDAVLDYDSKTEQRDADGQVVTKWDGRTTKPHPVTGAEVPDPEAREPVYSYSNPRPAKWPAVDYIVGNPPFIGNKRMRAALGDGYTDALRDAHPKVPESCDFVMYWWDHAGKSVAEKKAKRFGFITTNSITQTFNRKIVSELLEAKKPISLSFAIPDHPWVDSADGAAVRVAMTVGVSGKQQGQLLQVDTETDKEGEDFTEVTFVKRQGTIHSDLTTGANVANAFPLKANEELASQGVTPLGTGFRLTEEQIISAGYRIDALPPVIKHYCIGRDIVQRWEEKYIIDFYGLSEIEARTNYPALMQIIIDEVKPDRDAKAGRSKDADAYAKLWWQYAKPRQALRRAMVGLDAYIATCRTAKHRSFVMLDAKTLPDAKVVAIALNDYFHLGVLSSNLHVTWAIATGAWMGVGNDSNYNHSECFVKFPFPACSAAQQEQIRALGEQLDAHRKRQQALHPELTMTGMYNVLERVRALQNVARSMHASTPDPLNAKEKKIYEQGLVGILKQLHEELDVAVAEAYGWPADLSTEEILTRLVALNAERAAEEAQGHVRWLRPEYQNKGAKASPAGKQAKLDVEEPAAIAVKELQPWPKELHEQAAALAQVLNGLPAPASVEVIAKHFKGKTSTKRLAALDRLLETLAAVGRARKEGGAWMGV